MAIGGEELQLVYDMDETAPASRRANRGSAGNEADIVPQTTVTEDTIPVAPDGRGGRALDFHTDSSSEFYGETAELAALAAGTLPIPRASGEGFVIGWRYKWVSPYHDGTLPLDFTSRLQWILLNQALTPSDTTILAVHMEIEQSGGVTARPALWLGLLGLSSNYAWYSVADATGSPATYPVEPDEWYSFALKVWYATTGLRWKLWMRKESDGTLYTWTFNGADLAIVAHHLANDSSQRWEVNTEDITNKDHATAFLLDDLWMYAAFIDDDEIDRVIIDGISVPWAQPDYRRAANAVYSSVTNQNGSFPKPRPLPIGATVSRHPVNLLCQEARARVEGWRPGRPWAIRDIDIIFDPAGPYGSQRARQGERPRLNLGVKRRPGRLPWGSCEDARNVIFTQDGTRRRRGFKVRRDTGDEYASASCGFWTLRNYDRSLFRIYKAGTTLYSETGAGVETVDTAWPLKEPVVGFQIAGRLVLLSPSRRKLWDGSYTSIGALSIAPPGTISPTVTSGGTLTGTYRYAATWYDPATGDESGPIVASADVSPSSQRVAITLPADSAAPETRFTQFRLYRTNNGGAAPDLFRIATVTATTSSTVYNDDGDPDGTDAIGRVLTADETFKGYITSELPEDFAIGVVHQERAFYAAGADNPERVYICEPNSPNRNFADQWVQVSGAVRGMASWGTRLVVWTDTTTEILESDWIRTSEAGLNVNRIVVSKEVGLYGPNACIAFDGNVAWVDRHGAWVLEGQTAREISRDIRDLFPHIEGNAGERIVGAWDHVSHSLVWTVPCAALQADSSRMQTQLVMDLEQPGRWTLWGMEASFVGQFDDDRQGIGFGLIDHAGVFKELHTYEGDGTEGDEAFTTEDDGTDNYGTTPAGISDITGSVVTVVGSPGWTANALRGVQVVLRDRSTGLLYPYLIIANTTGTFTTAETPNANLAAGDGYYLGGIAAFAAFAATDFGSPNRKVIRQIQYELADLTQTDLYL